jgi:hypothetical protein
VNLKERGVRVANIRKLTVGSVNIMGKDVGVIDLEGLIHDGFWKDRRRSPGCSGRNTATAPWHHRLRHADALPAVASVRRPVCIHCE